MSLSQAGKVVKFAIYSRFLVLLLQAIFNLLIPDHNAGVFNPPPPPDRRILDRLFGTLFGGLRRWDGVYFIHIAEHGYTYENTLAFFPLLPLCVRILAYTIFYPMQFVLNVVNVLNFSACVLNVVLFVQAAQTLYELGFYLLKNEAIALSATLLFCINPASIFFSAVYSETMFAFFTLRGMLCIAKHERTKAAFYFGLSVLTRSNGLVNAGFILYAYWKDIVDFVKHSTMFSGSTRCRTFTLKEACNNLGLFLMQCAVVVLPFTFYQYYAYSLYCNTSGGSMKLEQAVLNYGNSQNYKMWHTGPAIWCSDPVPLAYSFVQKAHWKVGLLKYYEVKQIPNFLLALPIVIISLGAIWFYMRRKALYCFTIGVYDSQRFNWKKSDDIDETHTGYLSDDIYVYIVHLAFLLLFAVLFMHIQVTTRFLASSSPVIYWYVATITAVSKRRQPTDHVQDGTIESSQSGSYNTNTFDNPHTTNSGLTQRNPTANSQSQSQWNSPECQQSPAQTHMPSSHFNHGHIVGDLHEVTNEHVGSSGTLHEVNEPSLAQELDDLYDWEIRTFYHKAIFIYFHLFLFVGCAAFPNFLPWT